ncbi:MAG: DUF2283 domain-containing protein [bacterium]
MNASKITFSYDSDADILYVAFGANRAGIGLSINDRVLLRVDQKMKQLIGLTIFDYHKTAQMKSLELYGLKEMDSNVEYFALSLLQKAPLNRFFKFNSIRDKIPTLQPNLKKLRIETLLHAA